MMASGVAMIGAPYSRPYFTMNGTRNGTLEFRCPPEMHAEGVSLTAIGSAGIIANAFLMIIILSKKELRRWSQGMLFHQGFVDCLRGAVLLPMGLSILGCYPAWKCSLIETAFLLLATVSIINILTLLINDSPTSAENDTSGGSSYAQMDSPQCVIFGTFMIWFTSITIHLGPTFLSGGMVARLEMARTEPGCPMVHGPFRHYMLNALWIVINGIVFFLITYHLHRLYRDLTKVNVEAVKVTELVTTLVNVVGNSVHCPHADEDAIILDRNAFVVQRGSRAVEECQRIRDYLEQMKQEGILKVKIFTAITAVYSIFWGPLFLVTLIPHPIIANKTGLQVSLHMAYSHSFVNPIMFISLLRILRQSTTQLFCGCFLPPSSRNRLHPRLTNAGEMAEPMEGSGNLLVVPSPPPPVCRLSNISSQGYFSHRTLDV